MSPDRKREPDDASGESARKRNRRFGASAGPRRVGGAGHGRLGASAGSRRIGEFVARRIHPPRSTRGFAVSLGAVGGLCAVAAIGGSAFQGFSETEGFCSRCHTMAPEAAAHKLSVHRDVACGECHVAPGIVGLVKSKLRGTTQLLELVAGAYPKPIRPPEPSLLPPPEKTCMKCHPLSTITGEDGQIKLILHPTYREDEANTREMVAVMVRPYRLGEGAASRGAHWHVEVKMEYATPDKTSQKIDWIRVTYKDGRTEQWIARPQVGVSSDVQPDVNRLTKTEAVHQVTCISCHNRVGHEFPSPGEAIDSAIAKGKISQSLPYIKRKGVELLGKRYRSVAEADRAIEGVRRAYAARYPLLSRARGRDVNRAVDQLKQIYPLVADPAMNEISADYPNNLGHQSGPGCLRCHDGSHFKVSPEGRLVNATIPWECTTCHTFPQTGRTVSSVSVLNPPPDHQSKLWVFEHAQSRLALEPSANSAFCANCHSSGAENVKHEEMLFHHPQVIEKAGLQACGYCHREVFCARCHKKPVLGSSLFDGPGNAKLLSDTGRK